MTLCQGWNFEQAKWFAALVIAFIEVRLSGERDTWDLIIEKFREWLRDGHLVEEKNIIRNESGALVPRA